MADLSGLLTDPVGTFLNGWLGNSSGSKPPPLPGNIPTGDPNAPFPPFTPGLTSPGATTPTMSPWTSCPGEQTVSVLGADFPLQHLSGIVFFAVLIFLGVLGLVLPSAEDAATKLAPIAEA